MVPSNFATLDGPPESVCEVEPLLELQALTMSAPLRTAAPVANLQERVVI
jgi:hypothetical protein